ncbi:TetR/AcrR family transcriptional regulator [Luteibacter sp. PPL552]
MPSPPLPTRLTDRKRAAILDAAVAEFRQSGYEATSMDRVAARAGASKRTVYNHFPNKEALFAQILQQMWEASSDSADVAYRGDRPLRQQLLERVRQKLEVLNDKNFVDLARVVVATAIHAPGRVQDMITRLGEREETLTHWVRAACEDGRLATDDPAFAAMQLQALLKGFAFWPQVAHDAPPLSKARCQQVASSTVDMFLACYARER